MRNINPSRTKLCLIGRPRLYRAANTLPRL